jgi:CRISPR-associated protein Cse1 (CRISPR_cse1).
MTEQHFNLTTDPWIKVIRRDTSQETKVSLIELFAHAQDYRQLAGEMKSQDLAILRLLLAILTTVYSRFDAKGEAYSWLQVDDDTFQAINVNPDDDTEESEMEGDLLATWTQVYQTGHFPIS